MRLDGATFEYGGLVEADYVESNDDRVLLRLVVGGGREEKSRESKLSTEDYSFTKPDHVAAFLAALATVLGRASASALARATPDDLFRSFAMHDGTTTEEIERALTESHLAWLLACEAPPKVTIERVYQLCRQVFPIKSANELASLDFVSAAAVRTSFRIVVRLVVWQIDPDQPVTEHGPTMSIRDVKEQELYMGDAELIRDPTRFHAFLRGLERALARALCSPDVDYLMPHDLVRSDVLRLATAITEDDFYKALSVRSRLGKLMASGQGSPPISTAEELAAICRPRFPMRAKDGAVEFVEALDDGGTLKLVLRTATSEPLGLATSGAFDHERISAFLDGLASVITTISIGPAAPSALWFPELLGKPNLIVAADFAKALRAKARLGRFAR